MARQEPRDTSVTDRALLTFRNPLRDRVSAQNQPVDNSPRSASAIELFVAVFPMAIAVGSAVAFFLWALDGVTRVRFANAWLLYLLPVAGAAIGFAYARWGHTSDAGTRLIIDEIHEPGGGIPSRMAPFVLIATLVTHLFGGSAGREGTAVQMGGALASAFERRIVKRFLPTRFHFTQATRRLLLQAGMAAGFGAVFGTPLAGAIFAVEVLRKKTFNIVAIFSCLLAAYVGHWTVAVWGVAHTHYPRIILNSLGLAHIDAVAFPKVALAAVAFGLAGRLFLECAHGVSTLAKALIHQSWLRPAIGGCVVVALTMLVGTRDYLGLGVTAPGSGISIISSFQPEGAAPLSWLMKLLFTAVTVGSGFKGGEVTPLFFVGATLGNFLSSFAHLPVVLMAALGFIAVFGAAAKTPVACAIMGAELFGPDALLYFAIVCLIASACAGGRSLYHPLGALPGAKAKPA